MANPWRAPGNLRKSMEVPGEMGNGRINENSNRYTDIETVRAMPCARYPTAALGRHRPWKTLLRTQIAETDAMSQVDVENQSKSQCGWNHDPPISSSLLE